MSTVIDGPTPSGTDPSRVHLLAGAPPLVVAFVVLEPDVLVVRVSGELDLATAPELDARVRCEVDERRPARLLIDLSRLRFLGLHGIAVFERIRRRAVASHTDVVLVDLPAAGSRALEFAGVLSSFARSPDVATALAAGRPAR
jgi:anti-anti-sigma factor